MRTKNSQHIDTFITHLTNVRGCSDNTASGYRFDLEKFADYLGETSLLNVTFETIESYLANLGLSPATKSRNQSSIKSIYSYLYKRKLIDTDPSPYLDPIKVHNGQKHYLSKEQYLHFLKVVKRTSNGYRERDYILMSLLIMSGLRRAEVVSLNVEDVDLYKMQIAVFRKGGDHSTIPIHPELAQDLADYLKTIDRTGSEPLFTSKQSGNPRLSANSVWHLVKKYSKKSGFNGHITVHSLRHSFATAMFADGLSPVYIQELMGHKSIETTMRYTHISKGQMVNAFNKTSFKEVVT